MLVQITDPSQFKTEVSKGAVVVNFTASWCGPCQRFYPTFTKLAEQNSSINFLKVDIDANRQIAGEYQIQSVPTFIFFVNGKPVQTVCGAGHEAQNAIVAFCAQHGKSNPFEVSNGRSLNDEPKTNTGSFFKNDQGSSESKAPRRANNPWANPDFKPNNHHT